MDAVAYASSRSDYESAVMAHAAYYSMLAEREGANLCGGGTADGGLAQQEALRIWRTELPNIEEALDSALVRSELAWLLPITRRLWRYLYITSAFSTMLGRY